MNFLLAQLLLLSSWLIKKLSFIGCPQLSFEGDLPPKGIEAQEYSEVVM